MTTLTKQALETKLRSAQAQHPSVYRDAIHRLHKAGKDAFLGSGVIIHVTRLDGTNVVDPFCIIDGLSEEGIQALIAEVRKTFEFVSRPL
jgi:hypothetical protein